MIKKQIRKIYIRRQFDDDLRFDGKTVKEFDKNGNCIKINELINQISFPGTPLAEKETVLKYDNNNNLINKEKANGLGIIFNIEEYENKYDKNGNLICYDMKYFYSSLREATDMLGKKRELKETEKGTFKYDELNRLIKSKIVSDGREESIIIVYDDNGEMIKKDKIEILSSEDSYGYDEEKHRFYYNDIGQRLNEIKMYNKFKINDELLFHEKVIISRDEKLFYDKNDKLNERVNFFYDDKDRIKKEEWFLLSGGNPNVISRKFLYEYED